MEEDAFAERPYSLKTLMPGWQFFSMAYPKDNDPYNKDAPGPKNAFVSTYHRLGTWEGGPMLSESKESQRETLEIKRTSQKIQRMPLINVLTYHTTEGEARERHVQASGIERIPDDQLKTDYRTTMQSDFRLYRPLPPSLKNRREAFQVETKHRRLITDPKDIRRPGLGTFYDDNLDYINAKKKPKSLPPYKTDYE